MSRRALVLNGASGSILLVVGIATSFVMAPFLVKQLGNASYGFWELVLGLVGYLGVLDVGVGPAVVRFVAIADGSGDRAALSKTVNAGLASFTLAGIAGGLLLIVTTLRPAWLFGEVPLDIADARIAISLGALIFLLTFCRATFSASLMGLQYHRIVNSVRAVSCVVSALIIRKILPAMQPHALVALATIIAFSTFVELVVFAGALFRHVDRREINPFRATFVDVRTLLGFGLKSAGLMTSTSLIRQGILFVVAHALGAVAVTYYALSCRLIDYSQQMSGAIGFPLTPYFASAFGSGGLDGARSVWIGATRVIQFIQAGIATGVVWLGMPFLSLWMGPEYARHGAPVFYFLCLGMFAQVFGANANRMLVSLNQHGAAAIAAVVLSLIAVIAAVVACTRYGLAGAAAAAACHMVGLSVIELTLVCAALRLNPIVQIGSTVRRYGLAVAAEAAMLGWLASVFPPTSFARLPAHAALAGAVYAAVAFFTALNLTERQRVVSLFAARWRNWRHRAIKVG